MPSLLDKWRLALAIAADDELSGTAKGIAVHLLDLTDSSGKAWPSNEVIAARAGTNLRCAQRATAKLIERGWFTVDVSRGRGRANEYRPRWERAAKNTPNVAPFPSPENTPEVAPISSENTPLVAEKHATNGSENTPQVAHHSSYKKPSYEPAYALELGEAPEADGIRVSFDEWWKQYPSQRRSDKKGAAALYRRIIQSRAATAEQLLEGALRYAASRDVAEGFACNPTRWLREERWTLRWVPAPSSTQRTQSPRSGAIDALRDIVGGHDDD